MGGWLPYTLLALTIVAQQKLSNAEPTRILPISPTTNVMEMVEIVTKADRPTVNPARPLKNADNKIRLPKATKILIGSISNEHHKINLYNMLNDISLEVYQIENWYKEMKNYNSTNYQSMPEVTLPQAKDRLLNRPGGVLYHMNSIYGKFIGMQYHFLKQLQDQKQDFVSTCSSQELAPSVQQLYLHLYHWITVTAARSYLTISVAAELIRKYESATKYKRVVSDAKKDIFDKHEEVTMKFKHFFKIASREVWRCDPKQYIEDRTYTQLKHLFRKQISYEYSFKDFSGFCESRICRESDEPTWLNPTNCKKAGSHEAEDICNRLTGCHGKLWNCKNTFQLNTEQDLHIYYTSTSDRWFDSAEKRLRKGNLLIDEYGNKPSTSKNNQEHIKLKGQACDLYTCTCEELNRPNADEFISLEPVFSNFKDNRIITGVRLVKVNRTLRIEVQEGTLGKHGNIVNNAAYWVSKEYYDLPTDNDVQKGRVHKIQWSNGRGFVLGDLHAKANYVLTGIQFAIDKENPGKGVYLKIHTKNFDYVTGRLLPDEASVSASASGEIDIDDHHVSTLSPEKSVALNEGNKLIQLTTSGMKEDMGQTVIPFFDIQEVTTATRTALGGAGLYYKKFKNYGGFLGLKLFTYDFQSHFKIENEA